MSRIHEALKKAEQERTTTQLDPKIEAPVENRAARPAATSPMGPSAGLRHAAESPSKTAVRPATAADELLAACPKLAWKPEPNLLVFSNPDPFTPGTEQFRTLRTRLYRIRENQPLQTLLITSAIPAEGKTLVAANLAYAMIRQRGCRVLLIDADMRAPRLHALLGTPANPGLADYLQGGASEFDVMQRGPQDGLFFIPAGTHVTHPSELISNNQFVQLLETVRPLFDWIIIDSPPALPVADASVLATRADGVLFVVRAGSTPSGSAVKACQELQGANIVGVVLNSVEDSPNYGAYYAYGSKDRAHSKNSPR